MAAALFAVYAYPYSGGGLGDRCFGAYLRAYARLGGAVIGVFDRSVSVSGNVINGQFSLSIVKTCDAMEANLLYLAAVFAFPAPCHRRLIAAFAGLGLLIALNVTRICSLYFVGLHAPSIFELLHVEIWPLVLVLVAAAAFAAWALWMSRSATVAARAS